MAGVDPPEADPPLIRSLLFAEPSSNRSPSVEVQVCRQMQTAGKNTASKNRRLHRLSRLQGID